MHAQWDKAFIKYYIDPATGSFIDHGGDNPPAYGIPMTCTEGEFARVMASHPNIKWKILGKKLEPNNTRTTEDAFGFSIGEDELQKTIKEVSETNVSQFIPAVCPDYGSDVLMLFTRSCLDAMKAKGAKDKATKKAYCNGVGKAISVMRPDMQEKLKKIVEDAKENNLEEEDNFL